MNPQLKLKIAKLLSRTTCLHISKAGRHCHFPAIADSSYCLGHIAKHADEVVTTQIVPTHDDQHLDADLTAHFSEQPLNFKSACDVNDFLSALAGLLVRNRVSTRRASVLAYIASLQLRTLPVIDRELNGDAFDSEEIPRLDFSLPELQQARNDSGADATGNPGSGPTNSSRPSCAVPRPYSSLSGTTVLSPG
jgi:hypothetical protein